MGIIPILSSVNRALILNIPYKMIYALKMIPMSCNYKKCVLFLLRSKSKIMQEIFMKWEPGFNLGIEKIDEQHKKIVELINVLNSAVLNNEADLKISSLLDEMTAYADYHFKTEEAYFNEFQFPLLKEHISQHNAFIEKVKEFKTKYEAGISITFRLMNYLRKWLTNHILDSDREYVDIIKSQLSAKK
jgi:hemerythrin